ncbi:lactosylceramide 4-alpha-galactosyltransferase-like [Dioscorea cayenensis subsp. rotundata]|uniref:Lactosylceramide 4-alpha-galactosyltransferase-like n=1 Tax=Dioscorea cayennensis subsp. rotundata TaxID=55577 RepID=A0AB40C900_DIOCR|nr:lactosylceramide 4-alpha-galactosyltransferase-like [Dioscorea cayenensis subsp. rotundata]
MNMSILISKQRASMNVNPKKMIINSKLKFLKPNKHSKLFSARVSKFINSSCNLLFFMTWISSSTYFGPRELLSMESVFKFHPNACLLIVSNSMDTPKGARILKPYKDQGFKVLAISPDYYNISTFLFRKTPAESWFKKFIQGSIDPGEVSIGQNMSNLIRLAILYKFGGIYLDTDVILMKSLHGLKNVIGAQTLDVHGNWSRLNNAVMIFDKGHPLVLKFIEEFVNTFDGRKWGHNGPYLVSRVVERVAGKPGFDFSVLPPPAFYPVGWKKMEGLFERPLDGRHARWVKMKVERIKKESFALHLWNRESREFKVGEGSVIQRLIKVCCVLCDHFHGEF